MRPAIGQPLVTSRSSPRADAAARSLTTRHDLLWVCDQSFRVRGRKELRNSFVNVGDALAELVVIFPSNVWEYDVLDYFPFKDVDAAKKRAKKIGHEPGPPRASAPDAGSGPR
jgi:hypothetical protein